MAAESESLVMAEALNKFAFELHKCLTNCKKPVSDNLFHSPTSLYIALAMTSYGAKGKTSDEIMKVLHVPSASSPDLNESMKNFINALSRASDKINKLFTASKLFVQEGFEILEAFKEGTREFYEAELALVDYITNADKAGEEINNWVEKITNNKIKDLIPPGMLSSDTRLTLVNAIYFKGLWQNQFKMQRTYPESFFVSQNEEIGVEMMNQEAIFKYFESEELACQILEMPYIGRKMSMVVYLPKETHGLAKLEEKITYDNIQESLSFLDASSMSEVEVHMPKFQFTQQFDLKSVLSKMGANEMFIPGVADLSGIATNEPLHMSNVVHKTFVKVYEEGTEGAAVTAFVISGSGMRRRLPIFKADHPFMFLIRHNSSGAILFLGRLVKPSLEE